MKTPRLRLDEVESVIDLLKPVRSKVTWIEIVHIIDLLACCNGSSPATESSGHPKEPTKLEEQKLECKRVSSSLHAQTYFRQFTGPPSVPGDIDCQKAVAKRLCRDLLGAMRLEATSLSSLSRIDGVQRACAKLDNIQTATVEDEHNKRGLLRLNPAIVTLANVPSNPPHVQTPRAEAQVHEQTRRDAARTRDAEVVAKNRGLVAHVSKRQNQNGGLALVRRTRDPISIELE